MRRVHAMVADGITDRTGTARTWFEKRSLPRWIVVAALLLNAAAIPTGLVLDDNFHAVALRDAPNDLGSKRAPWDAFAFAKNPESIHRMIDEGIFPWWSDLEARFSFFRPLTSLTLWLDHRAWPESPALMHVQSLCWYALLLWVVLRVYRRFSVAPAFATLAFAVYALDDARAMTVGWIASRGALLALAFGFGALLAHDSWRTTRRKRWLAASVSSLAVGLLCAEAAVQALGYVLAYAFFVDAGTKKDRAWSLAPYAVVVVVWRVIYTALGYGAARTDLYVDPAGDPLRFLEASMRRLPILFGAQFWGVPTDLGDVLRYLEPSLVDVILPLCVLFTAALLWLFAPLWRSRREVRFWATGTLLSTIPICAVAPADRLLSATALGGSALVASLLLALLDRIPVYRRRARAYPVLALGFVNLVLAPLLLPLRAYSLIFFDRYIALADASVPDDRTIADKTVVMLNPPTDEYGIYLPFHRKVRGGTMPEHIRWLATADNALHLSRVDPFRLRLRPSRGFLPEGSFWTLRSPKKRSFVGETLDLTGVTYRVTDVLSDGRPAEVVVEFEAPLDSEEFVWLRWADEGRYVPFSVPDVGASVTIPAMNPASVLEGL